MPMVAEMVDAVIGIDTHRDSHEVEIADRPAAARLDHVAPHTRTASTKVFAVGAVAALALAVMLGGGDTAALRVPSGPRRWCRVRGRVGAESDRDVALGRPHGRRYRPQ
jgi:hypothetical protein